MGLVWYDFRVSYCSHEINFMGFGMLSFGKIKMALFTAFFFICGLFPGAVCAGNDAPPVWLTFSHNVCQDGYQVKIRGDRPFKVDNHFLIVDPPRIVIDIAHAKVEKNIYLKVNQPELTMIRVANREKRVRVVLDLPKESTQKYELQEKNQRVLITLLGKKKAAPKAEKSSVPPGYVSIQLHKAELADFFAIISKASGHRITVDESIKTPISLRLVNVTWQDALAQVLKLYSLDMDEQEGRWYVVAKK